MPLSKETLEKLKKNPHYKISDEQKGVEATIDNPVKEFGVIPKHDVSIPKHDTGQKKKAR